MRKIKFFLPCVSRNIVTSHRHATLSLSSALSSYSFSPFSLLYFVFLVFWATLATLRALHLEITPGRHRRPYGLQGIRPRSAVCNCKGPTHCSISPTPAPLPLYPFSIITSTTTTLAHISSFECFSILFTCEN